MPACRPDLDLHALQHSRFGPGIPNVHAQERAMGSVEVEILESLPHIKYRIGRKRDHVWYGPHEGVGDRTGRTVDVIECGLRGSRQLWYSMPRLRCTRLFVCDFRI